MIENDIAPCGSCLQSPQGQAMEYQRIKNLAIKYGKENKVSTAIYREGLQIGFAELSVAKAGNYPIAEVLSYDLQTTIPQVH